MSWDTTFACFEGILITALHYRRVHFTKYVNRVLMALIQFRLQQTHLCLNYNWTIPKLLLNKLVFYLNGIFYSDFDICAYKLND